MQIKKGGGRTAEGSRRESGEEREKKNGAGGSEGDEIGGLRSSGITHLKEKRERSSPQDVRVAISPPFSHLNVKGEGQGTCFQQGFTFRTRRKKEGGGVVAGGGISCCQGEIGFVFVSP